MTSYLIEINLKFFSGSLSQKGVHNFLCWCEVPSVMSDSLDLLWTVARQVPPSMGFSRQEYWKWLSCPPPEDLPDPGIEPVSLTSSALGGGFFTTSTAWERKGESEVAQLCLTLCDPMNCSLPGSSHGILQARVLEWGDIAFSMVSSQPRDRTQVSWIPGRRFNLWATREAPNARRMPVKYHLTRASSPLPLPPLGSNTFGEWATVSQEYPGF